MRPNHSSHPLGFARAACTYWSTVYPAVCRELSRLRARAIAIPDPSLRSLALAALEKRGNMEGAAAFATFALRSRRLAVLRAAVSFQAAYNHLDMLCEQPSFDRVEFARSRHLALLGAFGGPGGTDGEEDGGYLAGLLRDCRSALSELPSYDAVAPAALRAAERVVDFQSYNRGFAHTDHAALERWARAATPERSGLCWWETAAAGGSSLGVHVMLLLAASESVGATEVEAVEGAYFPYISALHSLLDQLVDIEEDAGSGQRNLIGYYAHAHEAAERMAWLASRSLECACLLDPPARHSLILAAMAAFYLASPSAFAGEASVVSGAVLRVLGPLVLPPLVLFRVRGVVAGVRPSRALRRSHAGARMADPACVNG